MKFIEPSVTLLKKPEDQTNEGEVLKYLERIGRVCYRSEDRIAEDSAVKFFKMLKDRGHWVMLEHFKFVVYCDEETAELMFHIDPNGLQSSWSFMEVHGLKPNINPFTSKEESEDPKEIPLFAKNFEKNRLVYRVIFSPRAYLELYRSKLDQYEMARYAIDHPTFRDGIEGYEKYVEIFERFQYALKKTWPTIFEDLKCDNKYDDVQEHIYIPDGSVYHYENYWYSIEFITSRAVANEIVRHRVASFAQESTRYCNYSKNKFGNELTFIKTEFPELTDDEDQQLYLDTLGTIESSYMKMIESGVSPQKARSILPCDLATKIVMTADMNEWFHFFHMRCDTAAHPDMQVIANKAKDLIYKEMGK